VPRAHRVFLPNESQTLISARCDTQGTRPRKNYNVPLFLFPYFRSRTMNLGGCIPNIIGSPSPQKERVASGIPIYFQLIIQRGGPVVG